MSGKIYPTVQEAIYHTCHESGTAMKAIAADLDLSPSNLSQRTMIEENPAAPFPASKLVKLQRITGDVSILSTMADRLGFEIHAKQERMPELVQALTAEAKRLTDSIQLVLATPWITQAQPAKGKR